MARTQSRTARWLAAVADAHEIASEIESLKGKLEEALADVVAVQEEYAEWRDNLPENLQQSALGEKLDAVADMDFDVAENIDIDAVLSALSEADGVDLPLGFGRD
jgi:hypothetical protein